MESSLRIHKASPAYSPLSPPTNFPHFRSNSVAAKLPPTNGVGVAESPSVSTGFGGFGQRPSSNTAHQPPTSSAIPGFGLNFSRPAVTGVRDPTGNFGIVFGPSPAQPSITSSDLGSFPWPNERYLNDRSGGSTFRAHGPSPGIYRSSSDSPPVQVWGAFGPPEFLPPATNSPSSRTSGNTLSPVQSSPAPSEGVQKQRADSWESVERPVTVPPEGDLHSPPGRDSGEKVMNSDDGDWEFAQHVDVDVDDNCSDDDHDLPEIRVTDKTDPNSELNNAIRRLDSSVVGINAYRARNIFLDSARKLSDNSSNAQNAALTTSLALDTNGKNGSENKRNRDESLEIDNESRTKEKEDVDANSSPARKRIKSSVQQKRRYEYDFTSRKSDSNLPIVHAVITTRRYRRNGNQQYRLEKLFSDRNAATEYAEEWTWAKFSKYEDDVRRDDLDVLGEEEEIGYYTPSDWNESSGMSFGAFVQMRVLE